MNSKDIVSNLVGFYCDKERKDKVVLIDGKWGCGKTYAVKTFLRLLPCSNKKRKDINLKPDEVNKYRNQIKKVPHQKVKYVSLFGVKGIEDVATKVYDAIGKKAKYRLRKVISVVPSTIASVSPFKRVSNALDLVSNTLKESTNSNRNKIKNKSIIIFDDLERVDKHFSYISFLGYINTLLSSNVRVVCVCSSEIIKANQSNYKEFCEFKEKTFDKIWDVTISSGDITNEIIKNTDITPSEFSNFYDFFNENLRIEIKAYDLFKNIIDGCKVHSIDYRMYLTDYELFYGCLLSVLVVYLSEDNLFSSSSKKLGKHFADTNLTERIKKIVKSTNERLNTETNLYPLSKTYEANLNLVYDAFAYKDGMNDQDLIRLVCYIVNYSLNNDFDYILTYFDMITILKEGEEIASLFFYSDKDNKRISKQFLDKLESGERKLELTDLINFINHTTLKIDSKVISLLKTKASKNHDKIKRDFEKGDGSLQLAPLNQKQKDIFEKIYNNANDQTNIKDSQSMEHYMSELAKKGNYHELLNYFVSGDNSSVLLVDFPDIMPRNDYFYPDLSSTFSNRNAWQYCLKVSDVFSNDPTYLAFLDSILKKYPHNEVVMRRVDILKMK